MVGTEVGLDVHVSDDDDGGDIDGRLEWNDGTDQAYLNPSTFGLITLGAVTNSPPIADAGSAYVIAEGDSLTLDGSGSSDPNVADILTYEWDLNYDGTTFTADATSVTQTITWNDLQLAGVDDDGTYQVALRVHDGIVYSSLDQSTLTVTNVTPTISVSGADEIGSGSVYTLNLSAVDPGDDTVTGWSIIWGDGSVQSIAGNPASVEHTYVNGGITNNILVSATDEDGTHLDSTLFVVNYSSNELIGSDGQTTTSNSTSTSPVDVVVGPDGFLYVANLGASSITRHDPVTGAFVSNFVFQGSGG